MPTFTSKPLQSTTRPLMQKLRKYPFVLFGLPFVSIVVLSSFALAGFTQTKYELHDTKVTAMSKEEEIKMRKDRKKIDIREEYFRLSSGSSFTPTDRDDLENVRVPRPAGMPEWGPARETEADAPKVGSRSTDRWV